MTGNFIRLRSRSLSPQTREDQTCFLCNASRKDILHHWRRDHKDHHFTDEEILYANAITCNICSQPLKKKGLTNHKNHKHPNQTAPASNSTSTTPAPVQAEGRTPNQSTAESQLKTIEERHKELAAMPGLKTIIPPDLTRHINVKLDSLSEMYLSDPTEENLFNIISFPKIALAPELTKGNTRTRKLKQRISLFPNVQPSAPRSHTEHNSTPIPQAQKVMNLVEQGKISAAQRKLSANTTEQVPINDETIFELQRLHPAGSENPFGDRIGRSPKFEVTYNHIANVLKTFEPDTAPGVSGWTIDLFKKAFRKDSTFAKFFLQLNKQVSNNAAPGRNLILASILTAIFKASGGIRPLAIPEIFYRVMAKGNLTLGYVEGSLSPFQFGVGIKGGVEPVIRLVERAIEGTLPIEYTQLLQIDLANAFNETDRKLLAQQIATEAPDLYRMAKWCYNEPSSLFLNGPNGIIELKSAQGGRQGDPLFPYFFSLAFKPVIDDLTQKFGNKILPAAYLDDITPLLTISHLKKFSK